MSPYVAAALIAAAGALLAALVTGVLGRRATTETNRIVKGNGKGDVSQMNEKLLTIAGRMESTLCQRMDRMDSFMDRQDEHTARLDKKMDRLTDRVGRIEVAAARNDSRAAAGRKSLDDHLTQQDSQGG